MCFSLRKSIFEANLFEILDEGTVVEEIIISFQIRKIPPSFHSLEEIHKWLVEVEKKIAMQSAYGSISLKNHSSQGLRKKLERKGFSSDVCDEIINKFLDLGFLKDHEFIQALIEKELRACYGPRYIEAKLRSQGLPVTQVREIITTERQRIAIEKLLKKKSKNQRAILQRRGFDFACIQSMIQ